MLLSELNKLLAHINLYHNPERHNVGTTFSVDRSFDMLIDTYKSLISF